MVYSIFFRTLGSKKERESMSILHLNQIKHHLEVGYSTIIDLSDVAGCNEEQREKVLLSRSLAAYSIQYHSGISKEVAATSIVGGVDDNSIDAIHYQSDDKTIYISQSKWIHSGSKEPEDVDVKKFISGIKDLFNLNFERFNNKIQAKKELITKAIFDPHTRYQIILTHTAVQDLSEHASRDVNDFLEDINDTSEKVYFSVFNQKPLYLSIASDCIGAPVNLTITLNEWTKSLSKGAK
jgi:hypothetical protein